MAPLVALALALQAGAPPPEPLTAFAREKARALLEDKLPCLGCHQLDGEGGRIGPDLSRLPATASAAAILRMIADPQGVRPGTVMPRTPMPEETRRLIARFLAERRAVGPPGPVPASSAPPPPAQPADATALYRKHCAACHGAEGRGDGVNAPYLPVRPAVHADRNAMAALSDDRLFDTIFAGGLVMNRSHRMPAYGLTLSRAEIRVLVRHIRMLCRCEGPAWSR